jgi:FKBP-type peptidyl-prolyl cis-trans isomerase
MTNRIQKICFYVVLFTMLMLNFGCPQPAQKPESTDSNAQEKSKANAIKEVPQQMSMEEVIFDPKNPPPGFTKCHRNHCHRQGGGVANYQQVMQEIGATKAINVPKPKPMPPAPGDVAAIPKDAKKTKSGLATKVLKPGTGKKATLENIVVVHYTAWSTDGKGFDSSVARGEPAMIPLSKLSIKGFQEGLQLMSAGEKRRLWMPEQLAFQGRRGKPAGMVVFDVELLEVLPPPRPR